MEQKAKELFIKYKQGSCTDEEIDMIYSWYNHTKEDFDISAITIEDVEAAKQNIWSNLPVNESSSQKKSLSNFQSTLFKVAASVIITLMTLSIYYIFNNKNYPSSAYTELIVPGTTKATLTLADGQKIDLEGADNGLISSNNELNIVKTEDGKIVYNSTGNTNNEMNWNILSIPVGGYYSIILSDGTVVWLNSKSILKFPERFLGSERVVELSEGEAYFDVKTITGWPFIVKVNHQEVEVLGTHFNVNGYDDEAHLTTTLLEGSIKLSNGKYSEVLLPNQQAISNNNSIKVHTVDANNYIGWVNNDFVFKNDNLGSIMRKISRWYDVEVSYPDELSNLKFSGTISRTKKIGEVLRIMELTGMVKFKYEGRRITVIK